MVTIIIVNFNTKDLLLQCIASIVKWSKPGSFEIVVVDNASRDGSVEAVRESVPQVKLLPLASNLGFGRANNAGAHVARGEFLLLLNSDTVFLNDVVGEYVAAFRRLAPRSPGALGTILLDREQKRTHSYGWFPRMHEEILHRLGLRRLPQEDLTPLGDRVRKVEYLTGAALFLERKLFLDLGGFDPSFFMYYEDNELQRRLVLQGKSNFLIEGPSIVHLVGQSIDRNNVRRTFTAVSKVNYYRLTAGAVASATYRLCFCLLEFFLVLLDGFRRAPNYTFEENARFLGCLVSGKLRFLRKRS